MGKVFDYKKWKKRKLAIIHNKLSATQIYGAYSMMGIPIVQYQKDDANLEEKFMEDSDSICGIVIGGGPALSPGEMNPISEKILNFDLPKLGICLGHEILGQHLGCRIISCAGGDKEGEITGEKGEVFANLFPDLIFEGLQELPGKYPVRMSHYKMLEEKPKGSRIIAETNFTPVAGFYHPELKIWGLQFHPEKNWMNTLILKNYYNYCLSQD